VAELTSLVEKTLARAGVGPGAGLLVACSGGPDSVALLDLLHLLAPKLQLILSVASLNHGLRPEAGQEVALVEGLARERGLAFSTATARPADFPRGRPSQEGARLVRLRFLERARREAGADWIALGHTADDQAETVLMRLIRGAGLKGLAGIPLARGRLVRPLLDLTRIQILDHLARRGLPFVRDPSNEDRHYLRARVRFDILPLLREANPAAGAALARLAEMARSEDELLDELAGERLDCLAESSPGGLSLDAAGLGGLPQAQARRVIRQALSRVRGDLRRLSLDHVDQILALTAKSSAQLSLPAGLARREGTRLILSGRAGEPPRVLEPLEIPGPGRYELSTGQRLEVSLIEPPPAMEAAPDQALLDPAGLVWPLLVRPPRPGDRIRPLGLGGSKKLSDLFIDRKVPRSRRPLTPVVVSGGEVVWVAGQALSRLAALNPGSRAALRLRLIS